MRVLLVLALSLSGCYGSKDKPVDIVCTLLNGTIIYKGAAANVQPSNNLISFEPLDAFPKGTVIYTTSECSWKVD
jgi:uncharacterized lipoprotein YehR (DUF1307 family)